MGSVTQPEQAAMFKRRPSNRVEIRNVNSSVTPEVIEGLVSSCGTVKKVQLVTSESEPYFYVIFDTPDEAQRAVEQLNDFSLDGVNIKIDIMNNNPASGRPGNRGPRAPRSQGNPASIGSPGMSGNVRGTGYPLRIMVPSEYVGAVIGRKGSTIKSITQRCKARVDVHGKENSGLVEKVISIYGQPENCTNACKEILLVLQQESLSNNRGEIMLKMLTDDRYCGRIIGKEGKMIKKIREDTSTKITVSNAQEMAALFPDRVITIRGQIDGMSQAEASISAKLTECFEQDQSQNMQSGMMAPSIQMGQNPGYFGNNRMYDIYQGYGRLLPNSMLYDQQNFYNCPPVYPSPMQSRPGVGVMAPPTPPGESFQISVPNTAVGAIIGTGGANIKQMMRESGAFVNIESKKDESLTALERLVTVKGNPDACWRASYLVFDKMKLEGFAGNDEVRLKTSILIPKLSVGRIIGKSGKNVRELQRATGAMIKLPEDPTTQGDEVTVDIIGNFIATRNTVCCIRGLVNQTQQKGYSVNGPQPLIHPYRGVRHSGPQQHQDMIQDM